MRNNKIYQDDINEIIKLELPWDKLKNKTILISGATGMIGTVFIDVIMKRNFDFNDNINIIGISRNKEKAYERFFCYFNDSKFKFLEHDINNPLDIDNIDYIIHAASNTHPIQYSTDPVGTIMTNILGTRNLLELGVKNNIEKFLFLSSVEIYGENKGDIKRFDESYLGYIDCNTLRAGYPESKRTGEALCNAYSHKYGIKSVTARLSRIYGPTMSENDSKAIAQFIQKAVKGEDIILKSDGNQRFSFTYVIDSVSALLTILLKGEDGKVYNVSDGDTDISLREIANIITKKVGTNLKFELPEIKEKLGYSTATLALMDSSGLEKLGWRCKTSFEDGIDKTIKILTTK